MEPIEPFDLAVRVDRAVPRLPRSRVVMTDVPATMAWRGHIHRSLRILEHLLANAVDHTPDTSEVRGHGTGAGGGWTITVEDDGPGVPDALRVSMFEPFARGPDLQSTPGPRLGLGLTLGRPVRDHPWRAGLPHHQRQWRCAV